MDYLSDKYQLNEINYSRINKLLKRISNLETINELFDLIDSEKLTINSNLYEDYIELIIHHSTVDECPIILTIMGSDLLSLYLDDELLVNTNIMNKIDFRKERLISHIFRLFKTINNTTNAANNIINEIMPLLSMCLVLIILVIYYILY